MWQSLICFIGSYGTLYDGVPEAQDAGLEEEEKVPAKVFTPTFDFDTNGIFYYLGTQAGTQPWKNPGWVLHCTARCLCGSYSLLSAGWRGDCHVF